MTVHPDRHTDRMALLVGNDSRIEGDQAEILHVMFGALARTLETAAMMSETQADQVAMKQIVRVQARLAAAGFVVCDIAGSDRLEGGS